MVRTTAEVDGHRHAGLVWQFPRWPWLYARSWERPLWKPSALPDITRYLWSDAPWIAHDRSHVPVDAERTAALAEWDIPIGARVGHLWDGVRSGFPYQILPNGTPTAVVYDENWHRFDVPLPERVVRLGDPSGSSGDLQWFGITADGSELWELSSLRRSLFLRGDDGTPAWHAHAVVRFDLTRPWHDNPTGLAGGGSPILAGIPRPEEFARGYIDHAVWLAVRRYNPDRIVGFARKTDGDLPGHPLYAGDRLTLHPDWEPPPGHVLTADEWTLIDALRDPDRGAVVNDKTGPTVKGGGFALPMDPGVFIDVGFRLTDFEVRQPVNEAPPKEAP